MTRDRKQIYLVRLQHCLAQNEDRHRLLTLSHTVFPGFNGAASDPKSQCDFACAASLVLISNRPFFTEDTLTCHSNKSTGVINKINDR